MKFLAAVAIVGLGGACLTVDVARADARKVVERYRDAVVRIALKTSHDTPESAHCTAFVVPPGNLLLTNAHCVLPALLRPPLAVFLERLGTTRPARVLGVDVRHDLAMLEVDGALDVTNAVDVVAGRDIPHGGKYVTLGFPLDLRLTAAEGTANARDGNVLYPELELSGTANPGASGSPLFDEEGVLAGILWGRHGEAQSVSFATPAGPLKDFYERTRRKAIPVSSSPAMHEVRREPSSIARLHELVLEDAQGQYRRLQDEATNLTLRSSGGFGQSSRRLRNWRIFAPRTNLRCRSGMKEDKHARHVKHFEYCYLAGATHLDKIGSTSTYSIGFEVLESRYDNAWQTVKWMKKEFNEASGKVHELLTRVFEEEENPQLTRFECGDRRIRTREGIVFVANFCLRGYVPVPGLFDLKLKAITPDRSEALVIRLELRGFSRANAWRMTEALLAGVREVGR